MPGAGTNGPSSAVQYFDEVAPHPARKTARAACLRCWSRQGLFNGGVLRTGVVTGLPPTMMMEVSAGFGATGLSSLFCLGTRSGSGGKGCGLSCVTSRVALTGPSAGRGKVVGGSASVAALHCASKRAAVGELRARASRACSQTTAEDEAPRTTLLRPMDLTVDVGAGGGATLTGELAQIRPMASSHEPDLPCTPTATWPRGQRCA